LMPAGTVLFTSRAPIGYTAIAANEISTNQGFKSLVPFFLDSNRYIAIYFKAFAAWINEQASGTTFREVSGKVVSNLPFPLPPLAEQHRIVAKVDELMALCAELETARAKREKRRDRFVAGSLHGLNNSAGGDDFREHARFYFSHFPRLTTRPEHIQQLRQTILNLAVRGKLVPQDPNDEPADILLQRIKSERQRLTSSGEIKKQALLPDIQKGDTAFEAPDGWTWIPLQNLLKGDSQNGCSKKPDDNPNGIPILRISAGTVRVDGIVAEEEHKLIGGIGPATRAKFGLETGDLLACRFNGNRDFVGRFALYQGYSGINPIYPDKLIRIRLFADMCVPELVRHFATSSVIRGEIEKYCATTVGNWGISATNLKKVPIPLPPLAEQHRIVGKVDELMALCDKLEAWLVTTATTRHQLLEATLYEALSGRGGTLPEYPRLGVGNRGDHKTITYYPTSSGNWRRR